MAFASDSDDDIVALNTPQPQFRSTALMRAQRTGPSAASSAPASRHAALAARDPYTTASTTKPTTSLLKGLSSDSEDDLNDQTLRKSPFNQINGFQKSARPPSTSTAGSMASRQPTSRTRSDTNLLSSCTSTSNGLGSSHKSISLSRRGGMARAHTTGPAGSSSSKRPALMPSSLKNSVGMFGSDSDDSGLSADEDIRRSIYKSRTLELDSQTSSTSATKTTTTTKGRSRSDPSEKARAAEAKKAEREAAQAQKEQTKLEKALQAEKDKAWQEVNKLRNSKDEAMPEIQVEMDYSLFLAGTGPLHAVEDILLSELADNQADVIIVPEAEVNRRRYRSLAMALDEKVQASLAGLSTIRVLRKSKATLDPIRRTFVPLPTGQVNVDEEKTVFVVLSHLRLLEMIESKTLLRTMRTFRECMGYETHQIALLTYALDQFFAQRQQVQNRQYTERIRNGVDGGGGGGGPAAARRRGNQAPEITVTREQLDMELMRLRVAERCYVTKVDKVQDVTPWLVSMIKDIAIRPYKLLARSHLPIPVAGGKFPSGTNAREVFEFMLEQIPRVTKPFAQKVASHFGSLRGLLDRCAQALTDSKGELNEYGLPVASNNLIQEIAQLQVERNQSGQLSTHRNKSSLARRILFVFMSLDALALVNS